MHEGEVGEPPDIAESYTVSYAGQQEVNWLVPLLPGLTPRSEVLLTKSPTITLLGTAQFEQRWQMYRNITYTFWVLFIYLFI
jgi:hypothetical protein